MKNSTWLILFMVLEVLTSAFTLYIGDVIPEYRKVIFFMLMCSSFICGSIEEAKK